MGRAQIIPANTAAILLAFQSKWIEDPSRLKLMEKSRQIGISWSTAFGMVSRIALQGARYDEWVSSRDEIQARLFLEDCKLWADITDIAARDLGEIAIDEDKHTAHVMHFANGRRIHSMSSNPDAQAGKRGSRVLDEFALHPDPRKLWSIAYPGITWGGQMEVISTHRGSHNFFNGLVREIKESGNPKRISLHTVTLQDALDAGFLWKLQQNLPPDDERQEMTEAEYFDWVKSGAADEESFQQEYMCRPADDDAAFLEYDLIASAEYGRLEEWTATQGGVLYAGVDIGRKKDLTVLWIVERLGDVLYTRHVECLRNMKKSDQEKVLWPWFEKCARVCIDATGLGIGWVDDAQDKFGPYRVEGVTFTAQVKEALAYPVRSRMEDRRIRIPHQAEIRADLRQVTKQVSPAGNIRFTAERTPDGHSDRFWGLALAIHAADGSVAPAWRPLNMGAMPASTPQPARTLDDDWIPG
jgi:phage FluMu gp28-like protein